MNGRSGGTNGPGSDPYDEVHQRAISRSQDERSVHGAVSSRHRSSTMSPMRREIERLLKQADAANAVPYELYDDLTARTKVDNAQAVIAWLRSRIPS